MGRIKKELKKASSTVKTSQQKTMTEYFPKKDEKQGNHAQRKQTLLKEKYKLHMSKKKTTASIYFASNRCLPFQNKIGEHHATDDFQNRLKQLSNTSVATDFEPICVIKSNRSREIESKLHRKFSSYRITTRREFFGYLVDDSTTSSEFERIKKNMKN